MKWLQDNPVGRALLGVCGVILLLSLLMAIVWTLPVGVDIAATDAVKSTAEPDRTTAPQLGQLDDYKVITERPVFNESRQAVVAEVDDEGEQPPGDELIAVADPPDVSLTGVVITPERRIVSLKPAKSGKQQVMAYEGESLTGEYVGWQVASIKARNVVLESTDGQSLQLDLEVNERKIIQPSKPAAANKSGGGKSRKAKKAAAEAKGEAPMTRADKIRQKIAERREQLRSEQEAKQQQGSGGKQSAKQAAAPSPYQNAMRAIMNRNRKDKKRDEKKNR